MSELSDLKISMHYCVIKLVVTGLVRTVHEGVRFGVFGLDLTTRLNPFQDSGLLP